MNRLMRYARGFNATILLLTQLLQRTSWTCCGICSGRGSCSVTTQRIEIKLQLRMAGVEPSRRSRAPIQQNWHPGRCIMRDLRGRVAEIQVDLPTDELLAAAQHHCPFSRRSPGMRRRLVLILFGALTAALVLVPVAWGDLYASRPGGATVRRSIISARQRYVLDTHFSAVKAVDRRRRRLRHQAVSGVVRTNQPWLITAFCITPLSRCSRWRSRSTLSTARRAPRAGRAGARL